MEENFFQKIGHAGPELRSWGVLDSVLRMMPRPQEILSQPARFLSYFISPEPPVDKVLRTESSIEFDLPVSADQYPLVTRYLRASFESLPLYVGQPLASCRWEGIHLKLQWSAEQKSIFLEQDPGHQISPELMSSVVSTLEKHQRELQEKNRELQFKNEQLMNSHKDMETKIENKLSLESLVMSPVSRLDFVDESSINVLDQNFSRLNDYMVRAQQLITMLVGQNRMNMAVKEAMKRTGWERVQSQYPVTVQESKHILEKTKLRNEQNPEGDLRV